MTEPNEYRSKERTEILGYTKGSVSTLIYGPQGAGKTTLVKAVVEEVNNKFGQAVCVDCRLYPTANAVLRETLLSLGSVIASKSNYDLTKRLKEKTRKYKTFIFLDHFESLKKYDILSILMGLDFCIFLIADSVESYRLMSFDLRTRFANTFKIERLPDSQVLEIVRDKADAKLSDESVEQIVKKSDGNLTLALNTVRSVEVNHGRMEQIDLCTKTLKIHSEDHSILLTILKQRDRLASGELYGLYCQNSDSFKSERSFRNYMQALCRQGLVKSIGDKRGRSYQIVEPKVLLNG